MDGGAARVHGDRNNTQTRQLQRLAGAVETRLFHPDLATIQTEHPQREIESGTIARRDEHLFGKAVDVPGDREMPCDFPAQLEFPRRVGMAQRGERTWLQQIGRAGTREQPFRLTFQRWNTELKDRRSGARLIALSRTGVGPNCLWLRRPRVRPWRHERAPGTERFDHLEVG